MLKFLRAVKQDLYDAFVLPVLTIRDMERGLDKDRDNV